MATIVRIDRKSCLPDEVANGLRGILSRDGLIVYPTDTLYGLGTRISKEGIVRVFKAKRRPTKRKPPILLSETHKALDLIEPTNMFWKLARKYWPGPLTIVAKASVEAPEHLQEWGYVGVRLPDNCVAREIAEIAGGYIIGTSANISGEPTPSTIKSIYEIFGDIVDMYIDSGPLTGPPSTVVLVEKDRVKVLRKGVIEIDAFSL